MLNVDIYDLVALFKLYGGASPQTLANTAIVRDNIKTVEFGFGVATLVLSHNRQHTVIHDDVETKEIVEHYCPGAQFRNTTLNKWEPELNELYDVIYIHHRPEFDAETILNKVPECAGQHVRIYVDNIPDEVTYNQYEELGLRLDLEARPIVDNNRLLVQLKPTNNTVGIGPGTELIKILSKLKIPKCQRCIVLANRMNRWGPVECNNRVDEIVEDMFPRAKKWWDKSKPWMKVGLWFKLDQSSFDHAVSVVSGGIDQLIRDSLREKVLEALANTGHWSDEYSNRVDPVQPVTIDLAFDADMRPVDLQEAYKGQTAFLLCGGPSLNEMDLSLIPDTATIAAVNQVGATHRKPHIWFGVDHPKRFHASIWEDPTIMKFASADHRADKYSILVDGQWVAANRGPGDTPNTFFINCDNPWGGKLFLQRTTSWSTVHGNRTTMLLALRMLYWLGFRTVYLLGCDFKMSYHASYAFNQQHSPQNRWKNNIKFGMLNSSFDMLKSVFDEHGYRVYNCTPGGHLYALPRLDYLDACQSNPA